MTSLEEINILLRQGLTASRQGSYQRRSPAGESLPILQAARTGLKAWISAHGKSIVALRSLALAEEALLDYDSAATTLAEIIKLSAKPAQKDLKRLASCRAAKLWWKELRLTPGELSSLGDFLKHKSNPLDADSLLWTCVWLEHNKSASRDEIVTAMIKLGYSTDYLIFHNLVPG